MAGRFRVGESDAARKNNSDKITGCQGAPGAVECVRNVDALCLGCCAQPSPSANGTQAMQPRTVGLLELLPLQEPPGSGLELDGGEGVDDST